MHLLPPKYTSRTLPIFLLGLLLHPTHSMFAAEPLGDVETATRRGLVLVTQAATRWQGNKTCFACHHQTLPMLAVVESQRTGFSLDQDWLNSQAKTTQKYFTMRLDNLKTGGYLAGTSTTAGYGLWALRLAQHPSDETTTALVTYLLKTQGNPALAESEAAEQKELAQGRWTTSCRRPPMQGSEIADTVLALVGLKHYATPDQQPAVAQATLAAEKWLRQAPLKTQEDRIWRLWGLHLLASGSAENAAESDAAKKTALTAITSTQHEDGGWPQSDDQPSDPFSTGQTLFVLLKTGTPVDDPAVQRARDYLLRTQLADGSWLVESRLTYKAQTYFDNGDPHGEHQFLSIAATSWATAGLLQLLPAKPSPQ